MISVISASEIDKIEYEELLKESRDSLIYMTLPYLAAVSKYTQSELRFVVYENGRKILAALPFCVFYGELGPVVNSLPFFGSNGGVVSKLNERSHSEGLVNALYDYAKSINSISVTLIESPLQPCDSSIMSRFDYLDTRISLINHFEQNMSDVDLIDSFHDPRPRNIRRAQNAGIEVTVSHSKESIDLLADYHYANISEIGGTPKSQEFFRSFLQDLPKENWVILEANHENEVIASLLLIHNQSAMEYFTPATKSEFRSLQPQSLLIYEGMRLAIMKQILVWNWGGTWLSQKGVYDFKKKWGAQESSYRYYCAVLDKTLLDRSKEELISLYPHFYVIPFEYLKV